MFCVQPLSYYCCYIDCTPILPFETVGQFLVWSLVPLIATLKWCLLSHSLCLYTSAFPSLSSCMDHQRWQVWGGSMVSRAQSNPLHAQMKLYTLGHCLCSRFPMDRGLGVGDPSSTHMHTNMVHK